MLLRYIAAISLLVFTSTTTHAKYKHMMHRPYADIYYELGVSFFDYPFWNKSTNEAFTQINVLKKEAIADGDSRLAAEADMAAIQYKIHNYIYTYQQGIDSFLSLERQIRPLNIYQSKIFLLRLRYRVSMQYYYHELPGKALEHQMKYYNVLSNISHEEYPLKKNYLMHIGAIYYSFNDYANAKKYLKLAESLPTKYHHVTIDIYNTLGLIMRNTLKYDSALYYFDTSLTIANKEKVESWIAPLEGNIGITYYLQKKYNAAIPLLKKDINAGISSGNAENITNSLIKLADIYRINKQYDSSEYYISLARRYAIAGWNTYKHIGPIYQISAKLAIHNGDYKLAYAYADSANSAKDSLAKRKRAMLITRTQRIVDEERHKNKLQKIAAANKLNLKKRNNIILILSLTTAIGILLLNRQHLKRKQLLKDKELAADKLKAAQVQLQTYINTLHEKNRLLDTSTSEIEKLQAQLNTEGDNDIIARLQTATILTDEDWEQFRQLFEEVHTGYIYRLRKVARDLTPAETRLVVLTKLKFTYKEMAAMLGVSNVTIRSSKSRLIKKLNLDADTDFECFAENI